MASDVKMKEADAKVVLGCGVYGECSVFSVEVARNATVEALQEAIFKKKRYALRYSFTASDLTLRLAWKEDKGWLQCDEDLDTMLAGQVDSVFKKMMARCPLFKNESGGRYLESAFEPGACEVHVLVERPPLPPTPVAKEADAKVVLGCGVYGECSVFSVVVARNATVEALQEAIVEKRRYARYSFTAADLTLRLAWKEDKGWLKCDEDLDTMLAGQVDSVFKKMMARCPLFKDESGDGYLESAFEPGDYEVHVLVERPSPPLTPVAKEADAKVVLGCGVYGECSVFSVVVARNATVEALQEAIVEKRRYARYSFTAADLTLRLAWKEDKGWLKCDEDLDTMLAGQVDSVFKKMMARCPLFKDESGDGYLESAFEPGDYEVHVLVERPSPPLTPVANPNELMVKIHENMGDQRELEYYQKQGKLIQDNCKDYCTEILCKIDELYASSYSSLPFICIEGSSGMGKTQLAFALEGRRPWFYWIATPISTGSQPIYENFSSISTAFSTCVDKDDLMGHKEELVLRSLSELYLHGELWTYGFIRALLEYCSSKEQQHSHMIHFDKSVTLNVNKCTCNDVGEVIKDMKKQKKELPFFILDEMVSNENIESGGMNKAAFHRNVFRALGLVVLIMGTDSKITNLIDQSVHSSDAVHNWMSVVPCFPPYLIMLRTDIERQAWEMIVKQYPVVETIARGSRGRFARCFVDEVVTYVTTNRGTIELYDLLDEVFGRVCFKAQQIKQYMCKVKGRYAQLMAISFTNTTGSPPEDELCEPPPPKKQKKDGTHSMYLHFANLVDKRITDVILSARELSANNRPWKPRCCFPGIEEDMLLYLAVLGGKAYSGYHDCTRNHDIVAYSTKSIFLEQLDGVGFSVHENTHAKSRDYKMFENMVAHALFCASRRNGVQGICFDDFYAWLLGEFQARSTKVKMTLHDASRRKYIVATDLFDGYYVQEAMENMVIPFLAPPNAEWPQCILNTLDHDCNFGHLVRACNSDRCDIFIRSAESEAHAALFLCECKHWGRNVDFRTMQGIIGGLNAKWQWEFVLVFCEELAQFRNPWIHEDIGCVKICCQDGSAEWVSQPKTRNRKKLVVVMQTGKTGLPARR